MTEQDIKIGQKWRFLRYEDSHILREVVHIDDNFVCLYNRNEGIRYLSVHKPTLLEKYTLVSDPDKPWLPMEDGWRLVTDEDKKHPKPNCAECYGGGIWHEVMQNGKWYDGMTYRLPESFEFEPELPKHKLFPIEWGKGPMIVGTDGAMSFARVGYKPYECNYRIVGYTDCSEVDRLPSVRIYTTPCGLSRKRKYAIGKLEEDNA